MKAPEFEQSPRDAAGATYWDGVWGGYQPQPYPGPVFEFHELYRRYLPCDERLVLVEIGAMPGNHMVYFHKEFGYRVVGIDYCSDVSPIAATMELNGIRDYALIKADVFELPRHEQYDVVFSSGFVEHFDNPMRVLAAHAEMVKPGGWLLIVVPNVRYLHKLLMKTFCPRLYSVHRDFLMKKDVLRDGVAKLGLDVAFCDYLRTFRPFYPLPASLGVVSRIAAKTLGMLRLDKFPNAFASPYLYLVAKRPDR
jgi:SAM-dependent methyltransferase